MEYKLTDRKFGVEIEFFGANQNTVIAEMRYRGLNVQYAGYTHNTTPYWKVVTDSSVTGSGLELVSPVLSGPEGMREVELACEALNAAGAKIDKTCGLHVHHDAGDFEETTFVKLAAYYIRWQPIIDMLVSPSRRAGGSTYCAPMTGNNGYYGAESFRENYKSIRDLAEDRYHVLNLKSAFLRHGTVEFRQHQGTTEYWKIEMWIVLTQNMVERAAVNGGLRISNSNTNFRTFRDGLCAVGKNLTDEFGTRSARNMANRFAHFAKISVAQNIA